jgi:hypothetical protein
MVSGQLHATAALPPVPIGPEVGWASEPVWKLWRREKSVAPAENPTPAGQPVARRYTDWATSAPNWKVNDSNKYNNKSGRY